MFTNRLVILHNSLILMLTIRCNVGSPVHLHLTACTVPSDPSQVAYTLLLCTSYTHLTACHEQQCYSAVCHQPHPSPYSITHE